MSKNTEETLSINPCLQSEIQWIKSNPMKYLSGDHQEEVIRNIKMRYFLKAIDETVRVIEN